MNSNFSDREAFLALCLAVASQDNNLDESERIPLVNGMKKAGLLDCEYELKDILASAIEKMPSIFIDGGAFSFDEKKLELFTKKIKDSLSQEKTEILFDTAVDIAVADGILEIEAELVFLKKIHELLEIKKDFNNIIKEKSGF
ncbi:MAG: tellurite resistance TerB family protein [Desulfobacteraceae bacterium]|nr:tellurite resistance TerB family protein [Desulfobacteraceae bacterium]MCB9495185.1 tellurite resistance TerB family protein [Desulfobacteraceae bacterium]